MKKWITLIAVIILLSILFFLFIRRESKQENQHYLCKDAQSILSKNRFDYSLYREDARKIVSHMTLEQKVGQMTLVDLQSLINEDSEKIDFSLIKTHNIGGVYVGANDIPNGSGGLVDNGKTCGYRPEDLLNSTLETWKTYAKNSDIPIEVDIGNGRAVFIHPLIGTDTPHGNQHVLGEVLFPQNIGLAATHDPGLFCASGYFTAASVIESGFNWGYSPTVAISHNPLWGRFYETMGSDFAAVERYAHDYVFGMQALDFTNNRIRGILSTPKHYLGDGATLSGIDEGNVIVENSPEAIANFLGTNIAGFKGGLKAHAGSIMVSYNAINGLWMSVNPPYLRKLFDGEYMKPFGGFTVSDQQAINKIATQGLPTTPAKIFFNEALSQSVMAGLDMIMTITPYTVYRNIPTFINILKDEINGGRIAMERVDDAVGRIIAVKYAMGLIRENGRPERGLPDFQKIYPVEGADNTREAAIMTALDAAQKSLVLLKNAGNLLPVDIKKIRYIIFTGEKIIPTKVSKHERRDILYRFYDDIGAQSGGWTVTWQGFLGNAFWRGKNAKTSGASSLLDGIKNLASDKDIKILHPGYTSLSDMETISKERERFIEQLKKRDDMSTANTLIIETLAEPPYAEFMGEVLSPYCAATNYDYENGCLYNLHLNPYMPDQQPTTLDVDFSQFDSTVIDFLNKEKGVHAPVISILFSGRPMIINAPLDKSNAFVAAFLPGPTGGKAIANALFGKYLFCNKNSSGNKCKIGSPNRLPVDWISDMEGLSEYPVYDSNTNGIPRIKKPLFEAGYGLSTMHP